LDLKVKTAFFTDDCRIEKINLPLPAP